MNIWIDVAVIGWMFAIGNILFGHFEERTPKWRRVLKLFIITGLIALISSTAGRAWSVALIGTLLVLVTIIHAWWLPKHGINGLTGEPKEKYYALRGWKV
jgi:predicted MFS family arabinose efflux permease